MAKLKARALGRPALLDPARPAVSEFWLVALTADPLGAQKPAIRVRATEEPDCWRGWQRGKKGFHPSEWRKSAWRRASDLETLELDGKNGRAMGNEASSDEAERKDGVKQGDTIPSPPPNAKTSPLSNGSHQPPLGGP